MQQVENFQLLLQNKNYSVTVQYSKGLLIFSVEDFPASFPLFIDGNQVDQYQYKIVGYTIEYNKSTKTLVLKFDQKQNDMLGSSILSDIVNKIQKLLVLISQHESLISQNIQSTVLALQNRYNLRIILLNHLKAQLLYSFEWNGQNQDILMTIKSVVGLSNYRVQFSCQPRILTPQLIEIYEHLQIDLDICQILEKICLSVPLQIGLDSALKTIANQTKKSYQQGSYQMQGFSCLPKDFKEIIIAYRNYYMISIQVVEQPWRLYVTDLYILNESLHQIVHFSQILHHCISRIIRQSNGQDHINSVNDTIHSSVESHLLDLRNCSNIENSLLIIFNYISVIYEIQSCIQDIKKILKQSNSANLIEQSKHLEWNFYFSNLHMKDLKYDIQLGIQPSRNSQENPFSIKYTIILKQESNEQQNYIKTAFEKFYNDKLWQIYRIVPTFLTGFIRLSLLPSDIQMPIAKCLYLELENNKIELLFHTVEIKANRSLVMTVRMWHNASFLDITLQIVSRPRGVTYSLGIYSDLALQLQQHNCTEPHQALQYLSELSAEELSRKLVR